MFSGLSDIAVYKTEYEFKNQGSSYIFTIRGLKSSSVDYENHARRSFSPSYKYMHCIFPGKLTSVRSLEP